MRDNGCRICASDDFGANDGVFGEEAASQQAVHFDVLGNVIRGTTTTVCEVRNCLGDSAWCLSFLMSCAGSSQTRQCFAMVESEISAFASSDR